MSAATGIEGFVTLRQAAAKIGRSTARTRQYVHAGQIAWKRDEMGHLLIEEASLAKFVPPERGEARASGVSSGTQLRHARATKKLVTDMISDGPAKATAVGVLNAIIASLTEKAAAEAKADPEAAAELADAEDDDNEPGESMADMAPADPAVPADFSNLLNKL